jgi:two-component system CheB/CheR fusion protein
VGEPATDRDLEVLLDYLRRSRGFDFTGYKRTSLSRRIHKRMQAVGVDGYLGYLDHLEVDPEEFTQLFNAILLNVTSFFRDPPTWEFLAAEILPRILADKDDGEPVRIWSAGCASGEEAYTLAMLAAEAMGADAVRERVKIYATDLDEEALNQARQARYAAKQVVGVEPELLERYFERNGDHYTFSKELRRLVIFGPHNLIQDAPIPRIDLLVCRNTLMYLNSETQAQVLARFSFALREGGYLLLGKAEMLLAHSDLFSSVDLRRRVFRKVPGATLRERLMVLTEAGERPVGSQHAREERIRSAALEAGPEAQIVVDAGGYLMLANARARALFKLSVDDLARPFQDLELSYRPLELRSKIQQAYLDRRPSQIDEVEWPTASGEVAQLEGAYAELQSTNEELQTINDELGVRTAELNQLNAFLESIWAGLGGAVVVLDPDLRVLVWNHGSEDLWGVRQEEVQGQHFLNLDIGLPIDQLRPALRAAMSSENGTQSTLVQATNRRGRAVTCRVTCNPLLDSDKALRGVIVVVVDEPVQQPPTR